MTRSLSPGYKGPARGLHNRGLGQKHAGSSASVSSSARPEGSDSEPAADGTSQFFRAFMRHCFCGRGYEVPPETEKGIHRSRSQLQIPVPRDAQKAGVRSQGSEDRESATSLDELLANAGVVVGGARAKGVSFDVSDRSDDSDDDLPRRPIGESHFPLLRRYTLGKVLGQGSFGVVYLCKRRGTDKEFAVKMIDHVESPMEAIEREVAMLRKLAHPCVVKVYDVIYEKVFACIVMGYCKGGDLVEGMQRHWQANGHIPAHVCRTITKMLCSSVHWVHKNECVHRDIKGDNYLMDREDIADPACHIYLSDFGTVKELRPRERLSEKCGTRSYWAPEIYKGDYGRQVDVWALGILLFGMVTSRFPFKDEEQVMSKDIKLPRRVGCVGGDFIMCSLEREELHRATPGQLMQHSWLMNVKAASEEGQDAAEPELNHKANACLKERNPNISIQARRQELVDRLEKAFRLTSSMMQSSKSGVGRLRGPFDVYNNLLATTFHLEWWGRDQVAEANFYDSSKVLYQNRAELEASAKAHCSEADVRQTLEHHGISVDGFGQGRSKAFDEFVEEMQHGQAQLMLDAAKYKSIVRVVDVVVVRISHGTGKFKKVLLQKSERFPDGRIREEAMLPGLKKLPYENGLQAAERVLIERLPSLAGLVSFEGTSEHLEEDEESLSYEGVRTVYRKEIYSGRVSTLDPRFLEEIGLTPGAGKFEQTDERGYTRILEWLHEDTCAELGVQLSSRGSGNRPHISTLVQPPIGISEEKLQSILEEQGYDASLFGTEGTKTLAEFSKELHEGASTLVRQRDGVVLRLVDVVILKLQNCNGKTLVEASQTDGNGQTKALNRLPAVKRRLDENPFLAVIRVLKKYDINPNSVEFEPDNIQFVEERLENKAYPGLPTLYMRRIIGAREIPEAGSFVQ